MKLSNELQKSLSRILGSRVSFNLPMKPHITWGVGGQVLALCRVETEKEISMATGLLDSGEVPWMTLGRGSNLLIADKGYQGVMLRLSGPLAKITRSGDTLVGGGGAFLPAAVRFATRLGLAGLEWAAGIPATVGGAVATNAGAMGGDMAAVTESLKLLLPGGEITDLKGEDIPAAYRKRNLPDGSVILSADLKLRLDTSESVGRLAAENLEKRRTGQPLDRHTAGSVFKNPPGDYAGRLIEAAGMKGASVGDAVVSEKHANFIVNRGGARARDILDLMRLVTNKVKREFGVELEPEVEIIGDV